MNENQDDRLWCTIFEIGAAVIGISMVVGAFTQIVKRFRRPAHKLLIIDMSQPASASQNGAIKKSKSRKTPQSK